ncbi:hypothetical protein FS594_28355 (plasmid) [Rahnella aquatilis]|nr:hypothetical protein FS594_28355 [Rahnella aquatilis]
MSGISSNDGPGWGTHDTPYGPIHSYDGNTSGSGNNGGHNGSSAGAGHDHGTIGPNTTIQTTGTSDIGAADLSLCLTILKDHEGLSPQMYADSKGNVTIGIGHLVAGLTAALGLPLLKSRTTILGHGATNVTVEKASAAEITAAFNAVVATGAHSALYMTDDAVIAQCITTVESDRASLRAMYSGFDNFPQHAKTAIHDMIFNLGVNRLRNEFPKFNDAVNRQDWATAAVESHRAGIQNTRNQDTYNQLIAASKGH